MKESNNKINMDTPETIGGGCMTGRVPSEQEFKELEAFFANRKVSKKDGKKQKTLQKS